ncbi:MAG: AAA family ATPase [Dehalococcoidia bacterium]|nr:AAA family ATPase [Dehalococcoidia bacterium]
MPKTPLDIMLEESMAPKEAEALQAEMATIQTLPPSRKLRELRRSDPEVDASDLISERFLYRGGVCLLVGPTGAGKSSLLMQLAIHMAVGKTLFGLQPGAVYRKKGMRILLVQAENDEAELAKMRDGVLQGTETLSDDEKAQAQDRIIVCTINDRSADRFALALDALLTELGPFDLVIVDPAFAYLGGDSNSQKDVSRFMRELLNPLLQRHDVGLILAHHTNKPPQGKEKSSWAAGDFAYLGAGSAEWINPSRAALAIRSIGSDSVFELRAPKRGKNLGWEDWDGEPTVRRYIAHFKVKGVICWREAEREEVEELIGEKKRGRPRTCDPVELLHCIRANERKSQAFYKATVSKALGCSETAVQNALKQAIAKGWVRFEESGQEKLHFLTPKATGKCENQPSSVDWTHQ